MSNYSLIFTLSLFLAQHINSQVTFSIRQIGILGDTIPTVAIADYQDQLPKRLNDSMIEFTFHPSRPECLFIFIEAKTRWFTRVWIDPKISHKELIINYTKKTATVKGGNEWDIVLDKVLLLTKNENFRESDSVSVAFVDKNPDSYFSLWLLSHGLYRENAAKKLATFNKLGASLKIYPEYRQIKSDLLDRKYPKIGDTFKEFILTDKNDAVFNSKSIKNKWILLYFWSNGCGPCIKEMDELISCYNSLDTSKIAFISVALDEDKNKWKVAKTTNKIKWASVWQPDNVYGDLCLNYNVTAMPFFILFNKEKKISLITFGADELAGIKKTLISIK